MHRWKVALFATALSALSFVSCSKSTSDDAIANDIKAKLYSDQTTKTANINVAVKSGAVTLTGDVPTAEVALEAMRVANGTPGIRSVSDQLTMNGAPAENQLPNAGNNTAQTSGNTPQTSGNTTPPAGSTSPYTQTPPLPAPAAEAQQTPPPSANAAAVPPRVEREPVPVEIPTGSEIAVRTIDPIDSKTDQPGQTFRASLSSPLRGNGRVLIPAGADVTLELASSKASGKFVGRSELEVRLSSIQYRGARYRVDSSAFTQSGASRGKQTAVRSGIGVAAGAIIGAIAGGGKGAAIGSLAGGGAGASTGFFTHGPTVKIPSESVLTFRLNAPLQVERR